jgi:hypothetical protein
MNRKQLKTEAAWHMAKARRWNSCRGVHMFHLLAAARVMDVMDDRRNNRLRKLMR